MLGHPNFGLIRLHNITFQLVLWVWRRKKFVMRQKKLAKTLRLESLAWLQDGRRCWSIRVSCISHTIICTIKDKEAFDLTEIGLQCEVASRAYRFVA